MGPAPGVGRAAFDQDVSGLFFLAATTELPTSFVQALLAIGFKPIPLSGEGKIVDIAIQRTAEALVHREADVVLVSHDGDFVDQVSALCDGTRQVGVIGFTEFVNSQFRNLPGLRIFDLEYDLGAFNSPLPRTRVIPIDEFDPLDSCRPARRSYSAFRTTLPLYHVALLLHR